MGPQQAIEFAIDKLADEIDREFDGADVSPQEERDYYRAVYGLQNLLATVAPRPGATR